MAKKTIATIVAENAETLKALPTHTDLRNWALSQGMDSAAGFSGFKKGLLQIGIDYDLLKKGNATVADAPAAEEKNSIQLIAEAIGGKYWEKDGKRRIYVQGGNNYHYDGKWYVDFKEDGTWSVECWLNGGYSNKNAEEYVRKHKKQIADQVREAEAEIGLKAEPAAAIELKESEELAATIKCAPVEIVKNEHYNPRLTSVTHVANLSDTNMIDHYHGCGKGYAYVLHGKVVAFQYGYGNYSNQPADAKKIPVEFSCTQICFQGVI